MTSRCIRALMLACSGVALLCAAGGQANAGGLAVREQSAYGQGTSFAGIAAGGDLSGMFWNPAVMTQFAGIQSASSYSGIIPHNSQTPTGGTYTTLPGSALVNQVGVSNSGIGALIPASYFSYQVNPNLWLGLSFNAPFGLAVTFPESWPGRDYAAGNSSLTTYNATPSVAYKINNWISVGAGMQIQYAKATLNRGVTIAGFVPFGDATLTGTGWAYGFTAGVTLTPTPATMIGLGYRSQLDQKIDGTVKTPLGVTTASTTVRLPDMVSLGIRQRVTPQMTLLGTVEWSNWSRMGTSVVSGAQPTTIPFEWRDGWLFSLGAEYQANDRLTLRTGFGYEISPVTDQVRNVLLPDADRTWASVGASYIILPGVTAHLAYSHIWTSDATINITAASGNPVFAPSINAFNPTGTSYTGTSSTHIDIISFGLKTRWDELIK